MHLKLFRKKKKNSIINLLILLCVCVPPTSVQVVVQWCEAMRSSGSVHCALFCVYREVDKFSPGIARHQCVVCMCQAANLCMRTLRYGLDRHVAVVYVRHAKLNKLESRFFCRFMFELVWAWNSQHHLSRSIVTGRENVWVRLRWTIFFFLKISNIKYLSDNSITQEDKWHKQIVENVLIATNYPGHECQYFSLSLSLTNKFRISDIHYLERLVDI